MSDETQAAAAETADQASNTVRKRAIVLVPGFRREERFFRREVLVRNLLMVERSPLSEVGDIEVAGEQGKRLAAKPVRGAAADKQGAPTAGAVAQIDVFEAFWADMIPESADRTPLQRLLWGFEIIAYWVLNWRSWTAFGISRYLTFGLLAGGSLLVLWYISIALLAAQAIGQDPPEFLQSASGLQPIFDAVIGAAAKVGNWQLWLTIAAILPFLKVDELVMLASFVKDYFQNKPDETEVGLRDRLRKRIQATLENVYEAGYDEVILLSHSFGTVLAIDLMADWPHRQDLARTTLVTMGSPVSVLAHRSPWLANEVKRLAGRSELATWDDYHAKTDWLCTAIFARDKFAGGGASHAMTFETRLMDKVTGQTHMLYFRNGRLLEQLVQPKTG